MINRTLQHINAASRRVLNVQFCLVAVFVVQTIVYHATKVITPELLFQRWIAVASLLTVTVLSWVLIRSRLTTSAMYGLVISIIIFADILFASFNVYTQRGYASKAVLLFILPIIIASLFARKTYTYGTALLAIAAYSTTSIAYFVLNFNEGYMAELYAELAFYSTIFMLSAWLLDSIVHKRA